MALYGLPAAVPGAELQKSLTVALNSGTQMLADPTAAVQTATHSAINGVVVPLENAPNFNADLVAQCSNALSDSTNAVTSFASHCADHVANFAQRASLAESAINLNETLQTHSNPCDLLQSLFGSIMGAGAALLNGLRTLMGTLQNAINTVLGAINTAIAAAQAALQAVLAQINAAINSILSMISAEVSALADWLGKLANYGLANLLSLFNFGPQGQCIKNLIGAVATPAAHAIFAAHLPI